MLEKFEKFEGAYVTTRTLPMAATVAAAVLLLTACGGGSDDGSDQIAGVPTDAPTSASSPTGDAVQRPKVALPADLELSFEGTSSGDAKKDAVWADAAERVRAMDEAIVNGKPDSPAVAFYSKGGTQSSARTSIKWYLDHGYSLTGTTRYYNPGVTFTGSGAALTYCGDESKGYAKDRKSGKVLKTPVTKNAYVLYVTKLVKSTQGVWQTSDVLTQRGSAQCRP